MISGVKSDNNSVMDPLKELIKNEEKKKKNAAALISPNSQDPSEY